MTHTFVFLFKVNTETLLLRILRYSQLNSNLRGHGGTSRESVRPAWCAGRGVHCTRGERMCTLSRQSDLEHRTTMWDGTQGQENLCCQHQGMSLSHRAHHSTQRRHTADTPDPVMTSQPWMLCHYKGAPRESLQRYLTIFRIRGEKHEHSRSCAPCTGQSWGAVLSSVSPNSPHYVPETVRE